MEECNAQSVTHSEELEASCGNDRCYKESFHELDGVFVYIEECYNLFYNVFPFLVFIYTLCK